MALRRSPATIGSSGATGAGRAIFLHSSDELYGADRMLLEMLAALPTGLVPEVWLPTDLAHPAHPLCDELTRRGIAVVHVDLPILRRAYRNPRDLAGLAVRTVRLCRRLRRARPSMTYCTTSASLPAALSARAARVPTVLAHVQEIWSAGDRIVLAPLAALCTQLLAISTAAADSVPARLRQRVHVVPNATPDPGTVPRELHDPPLRYLVASRWNAWKGHRTLLAAWDRGDFGHLTVLGAAPPSGPAVDVRALVSTLRRPDSVTVVGEVSDPAPFLREADVVLMPSDEAEPFGLIAIEAFAVGAPVIASGAGGLLDIVTDGVDGWIFPPGDDAALAAVMAGLRPASVLAAGRRARQSFEARFTTDRYAAQWQALVVAALSERRGPQRGPSRRPERGPSRRRRA